MLEIRGSLARTSWNVFKKVSKSAAVVAVRNSGPRLTSLHRVVVAVPGDLADSWLVRQYLMEIVHETPEFAIARRAQALEPGPRAMMKVN